MKSSRKLSQSEKKLIEFLIKKSSFQFGETWGEHILALPMDDGNMGSLHLFSKDDEDVDRLFGQQISEHYFEDKDGITVVASLNVDNKGNLFELDIWKTDFSPLIELPNKFD